MMVEFCLDCWGLVLTTKMIDLRSKLLSAVIAIYSRFRHNSFTLIDYLDICRCVTSAFAQVYPRLWYSADSIQHQQVACPFLVFLSKTTELW